MICHVIIFIGGKKFFGYYCPREYGFETPKQYIDCFDNLLCQIIDRLKNQIDIIKGITEDAITLPDDITVFRGVNSRKKIIQEKLSTSSFASTSIRPEIAKQYGGEGCYIFKIQLKKGTPVHIMPYKVYSGMNPYERFMKEVNASDPNGTKEILLNLDLMEYFELVGSITSAPHYSFNNGEFYEGKGDYIIDGKIEPKNKQLITDKNELSKN